MEMEKYRRPGLCSQYIPLDELVAGNDMSWSLNLKGGAFVRYRVGDVFKSSLSNEEDGIRFPQFIYVDRDPQVMTSAIYPYLRSYH